MAFDDFLRNLARIQDMGRIDAPTLPNYSRMAGMDTLSFISKSMAAQQEFNKWQGVSKLFADSMQVRNMMPRGIFDTSFLAGLSLKTQGITIPALAYQNPFPGINAIYESNRKVTSYLNSINRINRLVSPQFAKSGLQYSLGAITSGITAQAIIGKNFDFLQRFEAMSVEALSLSEEAAEKDTLPERFSQAIKTFCAESFEQFRTSIAADRHRESKTLEAKFYKWLTVLGFLLSLYSALSNDGITKQDVQILLQEQFAKQNEEIKALFAKTQQPFWITRCRCAVFLNPKKNSFVTCNVSSFSSVQIISTRHKWVYISFTDSKDSLLKAGWVMKKYLVEVKK